MTKGINRRVFLKVAAHALRRAPTAAGTSVGVTGASLVDQELLQPKGFMPRVRIASATALIGTGLLAGHLINKPPAKKDKGPEPRR